MTETFGTLSLFGPRARDVLAAVTNCRCLERGFPFGAIRTIDVAGVGVRALRVTYVGELGWELHMPIGDTGTVFDALMAAGTPHGIRLPATAPSNRFVWKRVIARGVPTSLSNDNPFQAGLGWAVKLKSDLPFLGRDAVEKVARLAADQAADDLHRRRSGDPLAGRETILRNGTPVGYLTSGGWGYTVGKNIGFGYVRNGEGVTDAFLQMPATTSWKSAPNACRLSRVADRSIDPAMSRIKA